MTSAKVFLGALFAVFLFVNLILFLKSKKFLKSLFFSVIQGLCALFAVNFLGNFIAVHLPVNIWTVALSSTGGISGVIMLLLCDSFL